MHRIFKRLAKALIRLHVWMDVKEQNYFGRKACANTIIVPDQTAPWVAIFGERFF